MLAGNSPRRCTKRLAAGPQGRLPVAPTTLFEKIWRRHVVHERDDGRTLLYADRHLVQDGSAPAFAMLRERGLVPRVPERAFATPDHYVPTNSRILTDVRDPEAAHMAQAQTEPVPAPTPAATCASTRTPPSSEPCG